MSTPDWLDALTGPDLLLDPVVTSGSFRILEERVRQRSQKGFTNEHDDQHTDSELVEAALAYATFAVMQTVREDAHTDPLLARIPPFTGYGWPPGWSWKPADNPRRNLVKAGALLAAEIDRLNRLEGA